MATYKLPKAAGSPDALLRRFEEAKKRKQAWGNTFSDCFELAIPNRDTFTLKSRGAKRNATVYDSTAVQAVKEFVARVQGTVVPPWRKWSRLVPGTMAPDQLKEDPEMQAQLDKATDIFFTYLHHSNFDVQVAEALADFSVSTGCLLFDEGDEQKPFEFKAIPLPEIYVEEGPTTLVETVWREHEPMHRNIEAMYPDADLGEEILKKAKEAPNSRRTLIEGTVYLPDEEDHYLAVVIDKKSKRCLWAAQYRTSPWIVFRAPTVPGEVYGRGPVMDVLPDIRTANKMVELTLRRAAFSVSGVYTAITDGVLNPYTLKLAPGTVIPVSSNASANPSLSPLPMGGEPQFGMLILDELRNNIKKALFNSMRTAAGPVRSATEVSIENRELLEYMGAVFGRLQTELIERIISRGVDILARKGLLPKFDIDGTQITLQHTSPLSRAQDYEELEAIERYIAMVSALGPEAVGMNINVNEVGREIGKRLKIDSDLIMSKKDQQKKIDAQEEASAAMIAQATEGQPQ